MLISCRSTRWLATYPEPRLATILVTLHCDNDCIFCGAAEKRRREARGALDADLVADWLDRCAAARVRLVAFSGAGDPLSHPDIVSLVRKTVLLGMQPYLYTQAHQASPELVESLVKAGLREIAISVHAHDALSHDALTRNSGSFARTLQGMRVFLQAGVHVQTNSVLTQLNAERLAELVDLLAGEQGVHEMAFSYPRIEGNAHGHLDLMVPFATIIRRLRPALARAQRIGNEVTVENIPHCYLRPEEYTPLPDYEVMYKDEQYDVALRPSDVEMHYPACCEGCCHRDMCPGFDRYYPFAFEAGPERQVHVAKHLAKDS